MNLLVSSLLIAIAVAFSNIIARYTKHIAGTYINLLIGVIVAIATPTDATAFDVVVEGRKIPQPIRNILKMESLFNDATGIILLQAGILWLTTGHLSFWQNTAAFFKSAVGGLILGAILAFIVMAFRQKRSRFPALSQL